MSVCRCPEFPGVNAYTRLQTIFSASRETATTLEFVGARNCLLQRVRLPGSGSGAGKLLAQVYLENPKAAGVPAFGEGGGGLLLVLSKLRKRGVEGPLGFVHHASLPLGLWYGTLCLTAGPEHRAEG